MVFCIPWFGLVAVHRCVRPVAVGAMTTNVGMWYFAMLFDALKKRPTDKRND
ncbi:hypothetical protein [Exiguobacterium sp. SH5S13]|uniref:hypothetical protein n=1 Tax=Exiguobacterium sp. SH5S13 TaxID=2510959 RepID=UPI0013761D6B|nr:hypothetical protein [Exiguobacterium sp. SH5S13]